MKRSGLVDDGEDLKLIHTDGRNVADFRARIEQTPRVDEAEVS